MGLIDCQKLEKRFNDEILFSSLSFTLNPNDRLAIIGNNGVGKTTLLKMILKEIDYDSGSITISPNTSIGYLSQVLVNSFDNTLYNEMLSVFDNVRKVEEELNKVTIELSTNPNDPKILKDYEKIENKFQTLGGYDYLYKIDTMISKFGFSKEDYDRKLSTFSGGERNKIAFTRLLLDAPDILILDEPTNHLDMNTLEWLEEYLRCYQGAIILVSHDRYFIDKVCNCILEISNKTGEIYRGNYSYYLNEKVIRYEQRLKQYNLQEKEIRNLENLIKRFKPKPTKVSLARDREKKLARILDNKIEKPSNYNKKIYLNLEAKDDRKVKQFTMKNLVFGYDKPLSKDISLTVFNGDKIGIIGENGIGKTTLLKTIYQKLKPLDGEIVEHRLLRYGYIDQNTIQIDSELTIFDYIHSYYPYMNNFSIRKHLGSFLFTDEDVFKTINSLSGGEKVRVAFALLLLEKYDVLLLDEPTNHMDIETRKVLESALIEYPSTIIFVSHDRYFIDELATKLIIVKKDKLDIFEGDYDSYLESLSLSSYTSENVVVDKNTVIKTKISKPKKVNKEKLEKKIEEITKAIEGFKELMYEEEYYTDSKKMEELDDKITDLYNELHHYEEEYMEILEKEE